GRRGARPDRAGGCRPGRSRGASGPCPLGGAAPEMNTPARSRSRAAARLAAVQALYQHEMEATPLARLLDEFHQHRLGREIEEAQYADAEVAFFDGVVRGGIARRDEIDALRAARMAKDWSLARIDKTLLQILRAGAYELIARADVTTGTA